MKILGIGVDIIENKRIFASLKKKNFIERVYNKKEIDFLKKKKKFTKTSLSKRFAAKEAFAKSLGTGFRENLNFKDIIILNDESGKPFFLLTNKIKKIIYSKFRIKQFDFFLSISDEKKYSIAFVILQKK